MAVREHGVRIRCYGCRGDTDGGGWIFALHSERPRSAPLRQNYDGRKMCFFLSVFLNIKFTLLLTFLRDQFRSTSVFTFQVGKTYGIMNVGHLAMRFLRIEKFIPFWGEELTSETTPFEVRIFGGFGYYTVSFTFLVFCRGAYSREKSAANSGKNHFQFLCSTYVEFHAELKNYPPFLFLGF